MSSDQPLPEMEMGAAQRATPAGEVYINDRSDSLVGLIANKIAGEISAGYLKPASELNSVDLAARFGTSRTPVREALLLLEKEGLVEIPPRRRPRVRSLSPVEVDEIYEIRAALNAMMIDYYIRRSEERDRQEMSLVFQNLLGVAHSEPEFREFRSALYGHWVRGCRNASLGLMLNTGKLRFFASGLARFDERTRIVATQEYGRLVRACLDGDNGLAMMMIRSITLARL